HRILGDRRRDLVSPVGKIDDRKASSLHVVPDLFLHTLSSACGMELAKLADGRLAASPLVEVGDKFERRVATRRALIPTTVVRHVQHDAPCRLWSRSQVFVA